MVTRKLHVTQDNRICDGWVAYVVLNELAVIVARADFNGLDDLRYYADREGYDGIMIGKPSVPWARFPNTTFGSELQDAIAILVSANSEG